MHREKKLVWCSIVLGSLAVVANLLADQTPSAALLVVIKDENALAIVDPVAKKVVGRVPVGEGPHEVEASADGKLAFVSNYGLQNGKVPGSTISVVDVVAQKELHRVDVGALSRPHGLWFAGGKLYFTAEGNKLIGRYNPAANQVDWRLGIGQNRTHRVLVSKDMNVIFASNMGSITVAELASDKRDWNETVIPLGNGRQQIDLSPNGKELWTAHGEGGDGGVSVIDVATKKVLQTLDLNIKRANRLQFTRDGKRVFISDANGNAVLVLDAVTRKVIKQMSVGASPECILMSPDGSRAFVALSGENNVAMIDLKTLDVTGHIPTGPDPDGLAWAERK